MSKNLIPSEGDFQKVCPGIIKLLTKSTKPQTVQEISDYIHRPEHVTTRYCKVLWENGFLNYVPIPADLRATPEPIWGYIPGQERLSGNASLPCHLPAQR